MVSCSIRRRFVNVLELILVLLGAMPLVEELLILGVVVVVILAWSHVSPIIPGRDALLPWLLNSKFVI